MRASAFCLLFFVFACAAARAGEEHMPLAGSGDKNSPPRVNVIRLVLPPHPLESTRPAAIDSGFDAVLDIPGVVTAAPALRDKRIRDAAREAALAPPEFVPFATRPSRIHLPPPIEAEPGFAFPGFGSH